MTTFDYQARAMCDTACEQGCCSLIVTWLCRLSQSQRKRVELDDLPDMVLKDIGLQPLPDERRRQQDILALISARTSYTSIGAG